MFEHILLKYSSLNQLSHKIIIFNTFLWRKGPTEAKAQESELTSLVKGKGRGGEKWRGWEGVAVGSVLAPL